MKLKFKDLMPYVKIESENPIAIIDRSGRHTMLDKPTVVHDMLPKIMEKNIVKISRYRYDLYGEEDFLGIWLDFDKEEVGV